MKRLFCQHVFTILFLLVVAIISFWLALDMIFFSETSSYKGRTVSLEENFGGLLIRFFTVLGLGFLALAFIYEEVVKIIKKFKRLD